LQPRNAQIVLDGSGSHDITLSDMVFQGTVIGPILWLLFFNDVRIYASLYEDSENLFADDLNTFRLFDRDIPHNDVIEDLRNTQHIIHFWGELNKVEFDPAKERTPISPSI